MSVNRILIVEDDPFSQDVAATILQYYGYPVDVVATAEDAINALRSENYRAAIIDLSLPQMDGWSLLRWIRENPATLSLPCVAITAYYSTGVAQQAIEAGFAAFFPKPIDAETFMADLNQYI